MSASDRLSVVRDLVLASPTGGVRPMSADPQVDFDLPVSTAAMEGEVSNDAARRARRLAI